MTRLRATAPHEIPDRPPIQVVPGQHVRVGQRDTEWPAFVFITTGTGAGWVPERYLDTSSDPAEVLTSYDTTELATSAGEELILIERDGPSGWARVRNAAGSQGWVPLRTIEAVPGIEQLPRHTRLPRTRHVQDRTPSAAGHRGRRGYGRNALQPRAGEALLLERFRRGASSRTAFQPAGGCRGDLAILHVPHRCACP